MANDESGFSYFRLRIPADLKAKIETAAQESGRSLNGQVLASIQASFDQADEMEELRNLVEEHEKRIDKAEYQIHELMSRIGMQE